MTESDEFFAGMQLPEVKKQKIFDKSLESIKHWLERFDTIIIGPGLGRDEMVHHVVIEARPLSLHWLHLLDLMSFRHDSMYTLFTRHT